MSDRGEAAAGDADTHQQQEQQEPELEAEEDDSGVRTTIANYHSHLPLGVAWYHIVASDLAGPRLQELQLVFGEAQARVHKLEQDGHRCSKAEVWRAYGEAVLKFFGVDK